MNREILFRGKRVDNGEWVEGDFVKDGFDGAYSHDATIKPRGCYPIEVIPETVGQYTGLKDKNDNRIFEGDFLSVPEHLYGDYTEKAHKHHVEWEPGEHGFYVPETEGGFLVSGCEIIGKIHDEKADE